MSIDLARLTAALEGRYRVERELGEGGMAVVYLADDLKHDRKVALKVLKPELAAVVGGDRFVSEIKTTANLQHPHILPLFDSGEADGFLFYVMPYVEGETLRERLDRERQLPVGEAVAIATKIAGALQAAHDEGVIHRDIKPANILLQKGEPVVSDFGIALAVSEAGGGRLTETGLSLGTPYYMAPEQATADRDPDQRSDIYSLACLTYEMLAGEPPFTGTSAQAVLGRILTQPPPHVSAERSSVPHNVNAAILQALQKLPADRFESVEDFADALNDLTYMGPAGRASGAVPDAGAGAASRMPRFAWPAVALVLAGLAAWGWIRGGGDDTGGRGLIHFEAVPDAVDILQAAGRGSAVSMAPDGRSVAYLSFAENGLPTVLVRDLPTLESRNLSTGQYRAVQISADGRSVLAQGAGRLYDIPLGGGPPRTLAGSVAPQADVTIAPDGRAFYVDSAGRTMQWTEEAGAEPVLVGGEPLAGINQLLLSEDGRTAAAIDVASAGVELGFSLIDMRTGERSPLAAGGVFAYRDGIVAWVDNSGGALYAQRVDAEERRLVGSPVSMFETNLLGTSVDLSLSGDLAYLSQGGGDGQLVRVSRDGTRTELGTPVAAELGVRVSRDGRYAVFDEGFNLGQTQVYLLDTETGIKTRVSFDGGIYASITPDSRSILYYRNTDGDYALFSRNIDGSGEEEVLLDPESATVDVAVVPGTDRILVREGDQARLDGSDILEYRVGQPDSGTPIAAGRGNQLSPQVSPNGRYLAYSSDAGDGQPEVFVRSLENPAEFWQISEVGGSEPHWSPDGTELYYRAGGELMAVPVDTDGPTFRRTGSMEALFELAGLIANQNRTAYGVAEDGFYFVSSSTGSVNIILNWWDEVERRVGAR